MVTWPAEHHSAVDVFFAARRRRWRLCAPVLAMVVSACQSFGVNGVRSNDTLRDALNSLPPTQVNNSDQVNSGGRDRVASSGLSLSDNKPAAEPVFFDGTGSFVGGDKPSSFSSPRTEEINDSVNLNLVGVPIPQAAKTVLGDFLGARYTVAPGLEGKITLQTPGAISKSEAVDLFQSALRSNNAVMIFSHGGYKILPLDQAAAGAKLRTDEQADSNERLGSSLRVVQLKYVNASEIRRILEPISARGGVVRVDDARNTITLSGNASDIDSMLEAISIFDVDVMKGMSFAIVPVKLSQPSAITDELKALFASEKEGAMAGMVQFIPNKRLGAILVITPQPKYLARALTWIKRLDAQGERNEKRLYTYSVQNRQAAELVDVLQSMFSNESSPRASGANRNVAPQYQEANLQSPGSARPGLQPASGPGGGAFPSSTPSSPSSSSSSSSSFPSGADSSQSGSGFSQSRSSQSGRNTNQSGNAGSNGPVAASLQIGPDEGSRIKVVADENKNALLIEATPADYRKLIRVVGNLDAMPNQVLIEATIAEIRLNNELKFGFQWFLKNKSSTSGGLFTSTGTGTIATNLSNLAGAVSTAVPGFSYLLKTANIATTLSALNEITDVNVISSPSLTVADSRTAALQVGDQVPIITQTAQGVITPDAPIVNSITYKDTGVILSITPKISESGRVALDIEQEVSDVTKTTSSGINSPTISQRRIRTSVVVNDGEVLALGGLIRSSIEKDHTQIPVLGDLPLVGNAFKMKDDHYDKTELIVLLVPHVMRSVSDARQVTDEFRREMAIEGGYTRQRSRKLEQTLQRTVD